MKIKELIKRNHTKGEFSIMYEDIANDSYYFSIGATSRMDVNDLYVNGTPLKDYDVITWYITEDPMKKCDYCLHIEYESDQPEKEETL